MKKEYIILGLIIVLLSAYLVLRNQNGNNYALPFIPEVKVSDIHEIILEKEGKTIPITKKDEAWKVSDKNYPAETKSITKMLDIIKEMKVTALISEAGENLTRYELDDPNRIGVTVKSKSETMRQFEIGKAAPSYRHTFIRLANNPSVYHAAKSFRRDFDKSVADLRDKSVLQFDQEKITEITLEKEGITQTLALTKISEEEEENATETDDAAANADSSTAETAESTVTVWQIQGDETNSALDETKKNAIKEMLSTLSTLKCSSYSESDDKKSAFKDQAILATLTLKGDKAYTLQLITKTVDDGDYPGLSSENGYPFFIGSYEGDNLLKKVDSVLGIEEKKDENQSMDDEISPTDTYQDPTAGTTEMDAVAKQLIGDAVQQGAEGNESASLQENEDEVTTETEE